MKRVLRVYLFAMGLFCSLFCTAQTVNWSEFFKTKHDFFIKVVGNINNSTFVLLKSTKGSGLQYYLNQYSSTTLAFEKTIEVNTGTAQLEGQSWDIFIMNNKIIVLLDYFEKGSPTHLVNGKVILENDVVNPVEEMITIAKWDEPIVNDKSYNFKNKIKFLTSVKNGANQGTKGKLMVYYKADKNSYSNTIEDYLLNFQVIDDQLQLLSTGSFNFQQMEGGYISQDPVLDNDGNVFVTASRKLQGEAREVHFFSYSLKSNVYYSKIIDLSGDVLLTWHNLDFSYDGRVMLTGLSGAQHTMDELTKLKTHTTDNGGYSVNGIYLLFFDLKGNYKKTKLKMDGDFFSRKFPEEQAKFYGYSVSDQLIKDENNINYLLLSENESYESKAVGSEVKYTNMVLLRLDNDGKISKVSSYAHHKGMNGTYGFVYSNAPPIIYRIRNKQLSIIYETAGKPYKNELGISKNDNEIIVCTTCDFSDGMKDKLLYEVNKDQMGLIPTLTYTNNVTSEKNFTEIEDGTIIFGENNTGSNYYRIGRISFE